MSGLFGSWHLDGRSAKTSDLTQCVEQLTPQGPNGSDYWLGGPVGLGCKLSHAAPEWEDDQQPLVTASAVCIFDGRLDNRPELCRSLKDHPLVSAQSPDSNLALAAYDRFGETFVERLEGDFALSMFDRRRKRLLIARDRIGLRPLCYAQFDQTFLFASDAKALLKYPGIKAVPDEEMLADFVLYFLAADGRTRTFFQGIHSLPPAHLLIATPEGVYVRRYFEFDTTRRLRFPVCRDYAEGFHELFVASVRNRLRSASPVGVSVSGGLDSSYIFCVAHRLIRDQSGLCPAVLGFNYGGPPGTPSDESGFVHELERACNAKIEHVVQRPGFMECAGEEVWSSESPSVEGLARLRQMFLPRVRDAGVQRFLTGHWGDQLLSDSDYLLDLLRSGRWGQLQRHRKRWRVSARQLGFRFAKDLLERNAHGSIKSAVRRARGCLDGAWKSPWFTPRFQRVLLDRFTAARLPRLSGTSHAWAMYQQSRLGYHLHCMEWNTRIGAVHGLEMAFPYLDCKLIQFLMSIPGEIQSQNGVSRDLERQAMRGIVPDVIVERRSKGEFTSLGNEGVEYDFAAIREILGPHALSVRFGYVNGPVLWKMLDQWRVAIRSASDAVLSDRVVDLCGLELLLRRFFANWDGETVSRTGTSIASC